MKEKPVIDNHARTLAARMARRVPEGLRSDKKVLQMRVETWADIVELGITPRELGRMIEAGVARVKRERARPTETESADWSRDRY